MRVLHLADRLTDRGGAYRHLLHVLEELRGGHELLLAVGVDEGTAEAPCRMRVVPELASRTRASVDLEPLVREFRPDLVHLHNLMNPAVLDWAAALGTPSLLTVQDHRYFCPSRGKWTLDGRACSEPMGPVPCAACFEDEGYFRGILGLTEDRLRAARRLPLLVLSSYMKTELVAAGVPDRAVAVIPPFVQGLDPEAEPSGPPCVLFAGRLSEAKGVKDAVAAWRMSGTDLPLVFAGTGPLRAELESEHGVEVLGWIPHRRLSGTYRRARALLMPSRWQEPFGIAGLEAASMGVPVAAYDSGGIREWHRGPGLVAFGDIQGLAQSLREAIGRRAEPPIGFEREAQMGALVALYGRITQTSRN